MLPSSAIAQTELAGVYGRVTDQSGAVIADAEVEIKNVETNQSVTVKTNQDGLYTIPSLHPEHYLISARKPGFKTVTVTQLDLNVQDNVVRNFSLQVGSIAETVTITADDLHINTADASVSTVVDRQFVENIPLNGRSLQTLLLLVPGSVVIPASGSNQGQFSINGQRGDANYFTVDGVSANIASNSFLGLNSVAGGEVPGFSALGSTSGLVSVDAVQEFRIQTSTFAPEFGRTPGGQVSIATRSGTNQFHGTAFNYLRNDALDANNWFADHNNLPKPRERQNDFGGVLGGPILRNHTFFFFSYEGLRLIQPATMVKTVPSLASRQAAAASVQPFLAVFPLPNGPIFTNGTAQFAASVSNPSTLNAYSLRVDHTINSKLTIFGRYNYSPSDVTTRGAGGTLNSASIASTKIYTATVGLTYVITPTITNEMRSNYSNEWGQSKFILDTFGGGVPPSDQLIFPTGFTANTANLIFSISNPSMFWVLGNNAVDEQRQFNLVDSVSIVIGPHEVKTGIDYRWLAPFSRPVPYSGTLAFSALTGANSPVTALATSMSIQNQQGVALLSRNFSLYAQDTWKVHPRLTLTYGLRWDVNPAFEGKSTANQPFTVNGLQNPSTMTLAPEGTPLYGTTHRNVAPRVGVAYNLRPGSAWQSVVRGGFGIFYDLGLGSLGNTAISWPFSAAKVLTNVPIPLTPAQAAPPPIITTPPVSSNLLVADPHLKLPRTYQWNTAWEQVLGNSQTLSLTYVGAVGRDLLRLDTLFHPNPSFTNTVQVTRNTATSDYHALQAQFRRRLARGVEATASYTWSHSIDTNSEDVTAITNPAAISSPSLDRGNSTFDIRQTFSGATSYDVPRLSGPVPMRVLLRDWSVEGFVIARTAPPVDVLSSIVYQGVLTTARPNVVPGVPLYLYGSQYIGGRTFNRAAFVPTTTPTEGDFPRNTLRGYGAWQADFGLRRQFRVTDKTALQFRAEFFNIFNHPNFGPPTGAVTSALFGQPTQILANSLSAGSFGLNPEHQLGNPRSTQLALKLVF